MYRLENFFFGIRLYVELEVVLKKKRDFEVMKFSVTYNLQRKEDIGPKPIFIILLNTALNKKCLNSNFWFIACCIRFTNIMLNTVIFTGCIVFYYHSNYM